MKKMKKRLGVLRCKNVKGAWRLFSIFILCTVWNIHGPVFTDLYHLPDGTGDGQSGNILWWASGDVSSTTEVTQGCNVLQRWQLAANDFYFSAVHTLQFVCFFVHSRTSFIHHWCALCQDRPSCCMIKGNMLSCSWCFSGVPARSGISDVSFSLGVGLAWPGEVLR